MSFVTVSDHRYEQLEKCLVCRTKLIRRYPGGDPENGPPIKFCPGCKAEYEPCLWPGCGRIFHNFKWDHHTSWDIPNPTPEEQYDPDQEV